MQFHRASFGTDRCLKFPTYSRYVFKQYVKLEFPARTTTPTSPNGHSSPRSIPYIKVVSEGTAIIFENNGILRSFDIFIYLKNGYSDSACEFNGRAYQKRTATQQPHYPLQSESSRVTVCQR